MPSICISLLGHSLSIATVILTLLMTLFVELGAIHFNFLHLFKYLLKIVFVFCTSLSYMLFRLHKAVVNDGWLHYLGITLVHRRFLELL